jgi:hypothetical protein
VAANGNLFHGVACVHVPYPSPRAQGTDRIGYPTRRPEGHPTWRPATGGCGGPLRRTAAAAKLLGNGNYSRGACVEQLALRPCKDAIWFGKTVNEMV